MSRHTCCFCVGTLWVVVGFMVVAVHGEESQMSRLERVRKDLVSKLDQTTSLEFDTAPLKDVLEVLSHQHDLPLIVDTASLDDLGLTQDDPITEHVKDVPLRFALRHLLGNHDLDFIIRDEAVVVVSKETAEQHLRPVVYPVGDLLGMHDPGAASDTIDGLTELIVCVVEPSSWDEVGGMGSVNFLEPCQAMVVSQTDRNHRRVAGVLDGLRRLAKQGPASDRVRMMRGDAWRDEMNARLAEPTTLEMEEIPLNEVVAVLNHEHDLQILMDIPSLDDLGITASDPISIRAANVSLRSLLHNMLRPLDLTYILQDGVVMITSKETAEMARIPVAYPVQHLLQFGGTDKGAVAEAATSDPGDDLLDFDSLIELLTVSIAPDSWDEVGGTGHLVAWEHPPCVVCLQTEENHAQIQQLLTHLAAARGRRPAEPARDAVSSELVLESYPLRIPVESAKVFVELIVDLVPEAGPNDKGAVIQVIGQQLVVKNGRSVQRKIQSTLGKLQPLPISGGGFGGGGGSFSVESQAPTPSP